MEIVLRTVAGYGWLGLLLRDGQEVYRTGRFWPDAAGALAACEAMLARMEPAA
jgi:hypothetical protein